MNESNNVITFPRSRTSQTPQSIEEIYTNLDVLKKLHVDETLILMSTMILEQLAIAGFDYSEEEGDFGAKETIFFLESLQALLMKKYGMNHPFHEIAEKMFLTNDDKTISMRKDVKEFIANMKGENTSS
jgi:hypothetical protein